MSDEQLLDDIDKAKAEGKITIMTATELEKQQP